VGCIGVESSSASGYAKSFSPGSVDRAQDRPSLLVVQHEVPQPVIVIGTRSGEGDVPREGQMRVSSEASHDAKRVSGEVTLIAIGASDMEGLIAVESHVEAAIAKAVKMPVAAAVVR